MTALDDGIFLDAVSAPPGALGVAPPDDSSADQPGHVDGPTWINQTRDHLISKYKQENVKEVKMTNLNGEEQTTEFLVRAPGSQQFLPIGVDRQMEAITRARQKELLARTDRNTGGDYVDRTAMGMKLTPTGAFNYLKTQYGNGNIVPIFADNGDLDNFVILRGDDKPPLLVEPDKDWWREPIGDAADASGDILDGGIAGAAGIALALTGGKVWKNFLPAAALETAVSGAASGIRQGIASLIPGEEDLDWKARMKLASFNALAGGVGSVVGSGAVGSAKLGWGASKAIARKISPAAAQKAALNEVKEKVVANQALPSMRSRQGLSGLEQTERGLAIEGEIGHGFELTPAQRTGDPYMAGIEDTLMNQPETVGAAVMQRNKQRGALSEFFLDLRDKIAANPKMLSNANVARRLNDTAEAAIGEMRAARTEAARPFYEQFERVAGKRAFRTDTTLAVVDKLIAKYRTAPNAIRNPLLQIKKQIEELGTEETGRVSGVDFQNMLSFWSEAAEGGVTVIDKLRGGKNLYIARSINKALRADLAATEKSIAGTAPAKFLQAGNQAWAQHSEGMKAVATDGLNAMLGVVAKDQPEKAVKIFTSMSEDQKVHLLKFIDKTDPALGKDWRAQVLTNIFNEGEVGGRDVLGADVPQWGLLPGRVLRAFKKHGDLLNVMFRESDPEATKQLRAGIEATSRLIPDTGVTGSQTHARGAMSDHLKKLAGKLIPGASVIQQAAEASQAIIDSGAMRPQSIAAMWQTAEGREAFVNMVIAEARNPKNEFQMARYTREFLKAATRLLVLQKARNPMMLDMKVDDEETSPAEGPTR